MSDRAAERRVGERAGRVREFVRGVRAAYHQVIGVPDYRAYLEHMRTHHPGEPCLSEREFFARWIDHKYCQKGPRCC